LPSTDPRCAPQPKPSKPIVDEENRRLCGKFGMSHGTTGFSECARYLEEVRKLHADRSAREFAGH
jgi:hypothetical protein